MPARIASPITATYRWIEPTTPSRAAFQPWPSGRSCRVPSLHWNRPWTRQVVRRHVLILRGEPMSTQRPRSTSTARSRSRTWRPSPIVASTCSTRGPGPSRTGRTAIDRIADGPDPVYGLNTGFGSLAQVRIEHAARGAPAQHREATRPASASCRCPRIVRAMTVIPAASLARGHSGVRPVVVERLLEPFDSTSCRSFRAVDRSVPPATSPPCPTSPLALLGEGTTRTDGTSRPMAEAGGRGPRAAASPGGEGPALINGTHLMVAQAASPSTRSIASSTRRWSRPRWASTRAG